MDILLVLQVIIAFGLLIFVHELGHFLAAKAFGIRVEAFSLGFPPTLVGYKWRGTEYRLSLIPIGGYVKLAGEQPEAGRRPAPDELTGRPVWQRVMVLSAGALMNVVLGLVAFILAYRVGVPVLPAKVGEVLPGSPAWHAGLQKGDRIVSLGRRKGYVDFEDLMMAAALAGRGERITLGVQRGERQFTTEVEPRFSTTAGVQMIGVMPENSLEVGGFESFGGERQPLWARLVRKSQWGLCPAREAGFEPGDYLVALNGKPLHDLSEVYESLARSGGELLRFQVLRRGEKREISVRPAAQGRFLIGVRCQSTEVLEVRVNSWADRAGLTPGDRIVSVNGVAVSRLGEVEAVLRNATGEMRLVVERAGEGERRTLSVPAREVDWEDVVFATGNVVDELTLGFPAERAGVKLGDRVLGMEAYVRGPQGERVRVMKLIRNQADLTAPVTESEGEPRLLVLARGEEIINVEVRPQRAWVLGLLFRSTLEKRQHGLLEACGVGLRKTVQWIVRFYLTLKGFLTGQVSARLVSGPVGILHVTYESARYGLGKLLYWIGLISINLALFNLVPVPILDGGHVLFALIEKAKGSPVSVRVQTAANYVGLALLLTLLLYVTKNDLLGFGGP